MPNTRADSSLLSYAVTGPDDGHEQALISQGLHIVAGVDEAGRGPLAGPVVAAAVVLNLANVPAGLNDSKKLTEKQREALFDLILQSAIAVSISAVNAELIDQINILQATMLAMRNAICGLAHGADHVLIDGNRIPERLPCPSTAIVKGDQRCLSIAAASIIAKVTRDRLMINAGLVHIDYGFGNHKGYGSAVKHTNAIANYGGIQRLHRFSFAPLKQKPPEGGL
jgi:ribonuclease HII